MGPMMALAVLAAAGVPAASLDLLQLPSIHADRLWDCLAVFSAAGAEEACAGPAAEEGDCAAARSCAVSAVAVAKGDPGIGVPPPDGLMPPETAAAMIHAYEHALGDCLAAHGSDLDGQVMVDR